MQKSVDTCSYSSLSHREMQILLTWENSRSAQSRKFSAKQKKHLWVAVRRSVSRRRRSSSTQSSSRPRLRRHMKFIVLSFRLSRSLRNPLSHLLMTQCKMRLPSHLNWRLRNCLSSAISAVSLRFWILSKIKCRSSRHRLRDRRVSRNRRLKRHRRRRNVYRRLLTWIHSRIMLLMPYTSMLVQAYRRQRNDN